MGSQLGSIEYPASFGAACCVFTGPRPREREVEEPIEMSHKYVELEIVWVVAYWYIDITSRRCRCRCGECSMKFTLGQQRRNVKVSGDVEIFWEGSLSLFLSGKN
jgi:hypothetical protein